MNNKVDSSFKFTDANGEGAGWYRFAKLSNESNGASGSSVIFFIKTYFHNAPNMSVTGLLNTAYGKSNITILGDEVYKYLVSSIRHVIDKSNNCSYLELYYDYSTANGISIELISPKVAKIGWETMELEKTEESVSGVEVYSSVNLKTKENYVVKNSDLINFAVDRKAKVITEAPTERYSYLFTVAEGHSLQVEANGGGTLSIPSWSKGIFITKGTPDGILISLDSLGNLYTAFRNTNIWKCGRKI